MIVLKILAWAYLIWFVLTEEGGLKFVLTLGTVIVLGLFLLIAFGVV